MASRNRNNAGGSAGAAREFRLPEPHVAFRPRNGVELLAMVAPMVGVIVTALAPSESLFRYGWIVGCGICLWYAATHGLFRRSVVRSVCVVGTDGVFVRDRFVPYAEMIEVCHDIRHRVMGYSHDTTSEGPSNGWDVRLRLVRGEELHLGTRWVDAETAEDAEGKLLVHSIELARAAWVAAQHDPGAGEDAIARGVRSGAEWLRALRQMGSGGTTSYRLPGVGAEQMSQILDDTQAKPSARAAAALALVASGDAAVPNRLRIAADSTANPELRIVLEHAADTSDDGEAVIAEALETLDHRDHARRKAR